MLRTTEKYNLHRTNVNSSYSHTPYGYGYRATYSPTPWDSHPSWKSPKFKTPTPDYVWVKIVKEFSKAPCCWWPEVSAKLFPENPGRDVDLFKACINVGFLEFAEKGKRGRQYYRVTEKGQLVIKFAEQFSEIVEFLEYAEKYPDFGEFALTAPLNGKNWTISPEFKQKLRSLVSKTYTPDCSTQTDLFYTGRDFDECVSMCVKHLGNAIKKIPWFNDFMNIREAA